MNKDNDDNRLIRACLRGEKEVFGILIDRYQKTVFNTALRLVRDYDKAGEIAQDVFVRAYERLSEFRPEYKFFSWIYKMTVNLSINAINRSKRRAPLDPNIISPTGAPDTQLDKMRREEIVQDAVGRLPLDYRVAVVLRHFADLPYREIAYILEIPEKTVKSRLFTARQRLAEIISKMGMTEYHE